MTMGFEFSVIDTAADFEIAKNLFREYASSLNFALGFQNFEGELNEIAIQYHRPFGGLILVMDDSTGEAIGCVGVRKFEGVIGELKRMYLQDAYRGKGLGKALLSQALFLSQKLGFEKLRLDTVSSMKSAIALYQSMGFYEIAPYRYNPNEDTQYYEIDLLTRA